MNHTYGQWEVTRWASHNDIHVSAKDPYGNYVFVANCGNPKPESLPTNENAEDNARLIAAAPEMYEALVEIAKGEGAFSNDRLKHAENCIENVKAIANKVLAKLDGKQ